MRLSFAPGAALVGGGSGGIGSAVVSRLAGSGVPVAFTYHSRPDAARRAIDGLKAGAEPRVLAYEVSVSELSLLQYQLLQFRGLCYPVLR